jgi:hypothetical protein
LILLCLVIFLHLLFDSRFWSASIAIVNNATLEIDRMPALTRTDYIIAYDCALRSQPDLAAICKHLALLDRDSDRADWEERSPNTLAAIRHMLGTRTQ